MINLLLTQALNIASLSISIIVLILLVISFFAKTNQNLNAKDIIKEQERNLTQLTKEQAREFQNIISWFKTYADSQEKLIRSYNEKVESDIKNITNMQKEQLGITNSKLRELINSNEQRVDKLTQIIEQNLQKMLNNNDQKLEQMRKTVDEKLNESLERRFNQSFEMMNKQFEQVGVQLGEMKAIASSVGDLQKVLTNVKTRGTFGEVQLGNLLEQILTPSQYGEQVQIKEGSNRGGVDFAIYLPGKKEEKTILPIDAKFPVEDYLRLIEASEAGKADEVLKIQKQIQKSIKQQAKSISDKYINPPHTTNFAIMYIAIEGLYSELLRNTGLIEELQRDYRIIISGPTTFSAILNSLQMGFKTLSIQKHSSEIWNALTTFKKEFGTFTDLLTKTQKKVTEASNTLSDATRKTRTIGKNLNKVTELTAPEDVEPIGKLTNLIDKKADK
jgi:DNA recombination protein RmuC